MKKLFSLGVSLLLLFDLVSGQCIIDKSNWSLVFNEDFNGTTQDLQNNWYFEYTYGNVHAPGSSWFEPYNKPENITVSNGYAYINTVKESTPISYGGYTYNYSSAILRSKFADYQTCDDGSDNDKSGFLYGMFEIRCKLPTKNGQFPAFWLTGNNSWPPEIDVFEYNGSDHHTFYSTVHYPSGSSQQGTSGFYNYPIDLSSDFHTYTVVWTPTKITWFFDGRELKTDNVTSHLPGSGFTSNYDICKWAKMDIILQNSLNYPDSWETSFDPLIVDYVKVYRPTALPAYSGQNFDSYFNNTLFPTYASTGYKPAQDWLFKKVVVPTGSYNAYSSLNVLQNSGKFYYKGDYNLLWTTYWHDYGQGGQYYATPIDWYHTIDGPISVASPNVNVEIPFFRVGSAVQYYQDGQFYEITTSSSGSGGSGGFEEAGFDTDGGVNWVHPALFADPDGLAVLYLANDNNLWLYTRTSVTSHSWSKTAVTTTGDVTSDIAISPGGFSTAFYRNSSNQLVYLSFSNSYNYATVISTVNDVYGSIAVSPYGNKVYYKTQYNEMYYYVNSGGWTRNSFSAQYPWSSGQSWQVYNVLSDIQVGDNPEQIYYIGTDNRIWDLYYDNGAWKATAISQYMNYAASDLKISDAASDKHLSFIGTDNQIRVYNYDYCEILNPPDGTVTELKNKPKSFAGIPTDEVKVSDLIVWPNPVKNELHFRADKFIGENSVIVIFDSKGQKIVESVRLMKSVTESIHLPMVAKGIYYLQIFSTKHSSTAKFIKTE